MGRSLQAIPPCQGSPVLLSSLLAGGGDQGLILSEAQPCWELPQLFLGVCRTQVRTGSGETPCSSHLCVLGQEAAWHRVPATAHHSDPG